jgi:hypothetical protein
MVWGLSVRETRWGARFEVRYGVGVDRAVKPGTYEVDGTAFLFGSRADETLGDERGSAPIAVTIHVAGNPLRADEVPGLYAAASWHFRRWREVTDELLSRLLEGFDDIETMGLHELRQHVSRVEALQQEASEHLDRARLYEAWLAATSATSDPAVSSRATAFSMALRRAVLSLWSKEGRGLAREQDEQPAEQGDGA